MGAIGRRPAQITAGNITDYESDEDDSESDEDKEYTEEDYEDGGATAKSPHPGC